jgi:secondary thiamine-phosphate synthase enzyme
MSRCSLERHRAAGEAGRMEETVGDKTMSVATLGLRQAQGRLSVRTNGQGLFDITAEVAGWLAAQHVSTGLLTIFCRHTSASLVIQENADPDVQRDLQTFFRRLVRQDRSLYRHVMEGDDDMPAHIRSALTLVQVSIPVSGGKLTLGNWQGLYLFEHRTGALNRQIVLHLIGA